MGFNGEKWWSCPNCGSQTKVDIDEQTRSCEECEWSVTIPHADSLAGAEGNGGDNGDN